MALTEGILRAADLYRFYHSGDDETLALRGVSLEVGSGEIVAIVGPSGSGKSTLLACLSGMDDPDGGTVSVGGRRLSRQPEHERTPMRLREIGVLYQSGNLIEHLTVVDNIMLAQRLAGSPNVGRARTLLAELGLQARAKAHPSQLSGGELCRAGLAVALANDPRVVLADEPTGEVDSVTEGSVLDLLRERASRGVAIVLVTHSDSVARIADRTLRLVDGQMNA